MANSICSGVSVGIESTIASYLGPEVVGFSIYITIFGIDALSSSLGLTFTHAADRIVCAEQHNVSLLLAKALAKYDTSSDYHSLLLIDIAP